MKYRMGFHYWFATIPALALIIFLGYKYGGWACLSGFIIWTLSSVATSAHVEYLKCQSEAETK